MEGMRKKRKITNNEDSNDNDNDNDNEDIKMETFFALLRNVKHIRDRLLGLHGSDDPAKTKTKPTTTVRMVETGVEEDKLDNNTIWKPSFQPEDFGEIGVEKIDNKTNNEDDDEDDEDERVMNNKQDGDGKNYDNDQSKNNGRIALDLNLSL